MNKWMRKTGGLFLWMMLVTLLACAPAAEEPTKKVLRLGLVPFETGEELLKDVQPLMDVIEKGMDMEVRPIVAADYAGVVEALKNKQLDIAFLSPASYVLAKQEANVKVLLKSKYSSTGQPHFFGAIIVRTDSPIKSMKDLKGKRFSFGDPISTTGHIFARILMKESGINPDTDLDNVVYSGSHDATILAVLNKKVDAGATYAYDKENKLTAWSRFLKPEEQKHIRVLAYSGPIPADTICASQDLAPDLAEKFRQTMLAYTATAEGKALMRKLYHFDGYVPAEDADYKSVREGFAAAGIDLKEKLKKDK